MYCMHYSENPTMDLHVTAFVLMDNDNLPTTILQYFIQ